MSPVPFFFHQKTTTGRRQPTMFGHWTTLLLGRVPGQLVIQITDRCNARCPQCGMRATERFTRSDLSLDEIKRNVDRAAELGFVAVSFTGGEPLLRLDDLVEAINHAGRAGIKYIRSGTNGFPLQRAMGPQFAGRVRELAERLAATPLRNFWISIDSADPGTHERMRGLPGVVEAIEKALPIFHECGLYPSANLGVNRNVGGVATADVAFDGHDDKADRSRFEEQYRQAFCGFYRRVIDMGFTIVNACYPMSVEPGSDNGDLKAVYAATSRQGVVRYSAAEKACLFRALLAAVGQFRSKIRLFSPRASLHALTRQYDGQPSASSPCRGGVDFFFVDSKDGNTYPCGYRGDDDLGKLYEWNNLPAGDGAGAGCRRCDWECFRDPSELAGPLLQALSAPLQLWRKRRSDPEFFRYWIDDLKYYRACGLFDGRQPPRLASLRKFEDRTLRVEHDRSDHFPAPRAHFPARSRAESCTSKG